MVIYNRFIVHFGEGVDTSGTTDEDLAIIFGVEVDESFGTKHSVFQFHRAGESCLFIDGEKAFDSRVLKFGIGDSSQRHRDTYSVISSEGSAFGFKPFAVNIGLNRIGHEIMGHITVLLAYHVHVRLKDDAFMVFVSRCGRNAHDDIHGLVRHALNMMDCCEILQPFTNLFLMLRGSRYFAYLSKDVKHFFGHISVVLVVY